MTATASFPPAPAGDGVERTDVVIVGAGPTGLMLAGELRLAGVEVVVLEALERPAGQSRAPGVYAATLAAWHQRGLLELFGDRLRPAAAGHFALLAGGLDLRPLDTDRPAALIGQAEVEQVLAEWATGLGAWIRRGHRVVGLTRAPGGVRALVTGPAGTYHLDADYLVGCDGGRSTVRRAAGFTFAGTSATAEVLLADVRGVPASQLRTLPRAPFPFLRNERGWVGLTLLDADTTRVFVRGPARAPAPGGAAPTFEEIRDSAARIAGLDLSGGVPIWVSRFGNATRKVTESVRGRVVLAGDAAHVHPPFGGQGLGLGIADAVNLGWKLAATVRGRAPAGLLDTYHAERYPAVAAVLRLTQAQDVLMGGGPAVDALREVLTRVFAEPDANRLMAAEVTGLGLRHDLGDDHPLVGRRLPDRALRTADGTPTSTSRLLHPARGVLLDLSANPGAGFGADLDTGFGAGLGASFAPSRLGAGWADRVDTVAARLEEATDTAAADGRPGDELARLAAVLVRPDGQVAWVAQHGDPPDEAGLRTALTRWFGAADADAVAGGPRPGTGRSQHRTHRP
ncbi:MULTISPECIES: FAD-dependent monooxygenase [Protofrankia]|uniref:FAD-dependent monooxygenase n=1 Tax=Protofrankia TaxID=2994361 RepID=UPI000680836B|nr:MULTISPECIES: FAD-dependent monooxygenase [Protofrankia]